MILESKAFRGHDTSTAAANCRKREALRLGPLAKEEHKSGYMLYLKILQDPGTFLAIPTLIVL